MLQIIIMIVKALTTFIFKNNVVSHLYHLVPKVLVNHQHSFSTLKYVTAIQKFREDPDAKNVDSLVTQMSSMNDLNREKALQLVLGGIMTGQYPNNLLTDPKFLIQLKKSSEFYIEAFLFRIDQSLEHLQKFEKQNNENGKKIVVKDMNESFVRVFQAIKKVPRAKALDFEIRVYKQFASYHLKCLYNIVDPLRKREVLLKSIQFYKAGLAKIEPAFYEKDQGSKPETQEQQEGIVPVLDRFDLVQYGSQMIFDLVGAQDILTKTFANKERSRREMIKRSQTEKTLSFKYHEGLYDLIPLINNILQLYSKTQIKQYDYYLKIKKFSLELNNHFTEAKCTTREGIQKEKKELQLRFEQLYKEIENIIVNKKDQNEQSIQELALVLFSLKMQTINSDKIQLTKFKELLTNQIRHILNLISEPSLKRLISSKLTDAIKQIYNIDLQQQFGKLPRSLRVKRSK